MEPAHRATGFQLGFFDHAHFRIYRPDNLFGVEKVSIPRIETEESKISEALSLNLQAQNGL